MELKSLLSVVIAVLTALGGMLYAMGSQSPVLAMALWLAAVVSLVVTDFLGAVRLPRNLSSLLMWGVLAVFMPHFLVQSWDGRLQSVAGALIGLQITLLFQEKDARVYGWLAVMSLLQAVVAARYNQGVAFGGLLVVYAIVGIFALSLLVLYSPWGRHRGKTIVSRSRMGFSPSSPEDGLKPILPAATSPRWQLSSMKTSFTSAPAVSGPSGVVAELFARLALVTVGGLLMAAIIFYTVPRYRLSAWRGEGPKTVSTVGFNDQITLGGLGETLESPEEVMQLKLLDPLTRQVYPMRDDIYLRGTVVSWYSHNHWRATPPDDTSVGNAGFPTAGHGVPQIGRTLSVRNAAEGVPYRRNDSDPSDPAFQIGPAVTQQITMETYLDRNDLFYIWPLIGPVGNDDLRYDRPSGRLSRKPGWTAEPRDGHFKFELDTSGLVDGHQAPLVPANRAINVEPYLQMPEAPWPLPRLTALAAQCRSESGLSAHKQYDIARSFEQQLSSSGEFHYSLQGTERDTSIDAIEDFVSNNPRGHCEYFATALALMLRSQGIPSRVVLGYHCDEWHEDRQCYQVRQLHAHAWVEAFLAPDQIPEGLRSSERIDWSNGGWLRLDPTPAGEIGTRAAESTMWGAWQQRWHGFERYWDKYIVDMDRKTQQDSVYEPISRATREFAGNLFNRRWWQDLAAGLWSSLAATLRSGIMGWLFGVALLIGLPIALAAAGWWLVRRLRRLWQRFAGTGSQRQAEARNSIEFYHRFEQIVARLGLQRAAGQTPREFARDAGTRLAAVSGRHELYAWALQVAEIYYSVRFGRCVLDPAAARTVEQALEELTAGAENPTPL